MILEQILFTFGGFESFWTIYGHPKKLSSIYVFFSIAYYHENITFAMRICSQMSSFIVFEYF